MAVKIVLILLLFSVSLGHAQRLLDVECQSAVGVVGEDTTIPCSFNTITENLDIYISAVKIKKKGQKDPLFYINYNDQVVKGDPRIKLPSRTDPSVLFTSTTVSDEGEYLYELQTNRGVIKDGRFNLSVTGSAEYHQPVINSWHKVIKDRGRAELHCGANSGYPAGTIHWFDSKGTSWTEKATMEIKEAEDEQLTMSSTLTLTSTDFRLEPFRCVILNGNLIKVEEAKFDLWMIDDPLSSPDTTLLLVGVGLLVLFLILLLVAIIFLYFKITNKAQRVSSMEREMQVMV
ncbi:uncharacterized protein [Hoplias malabaricus]|uniref:uncharacterized protein n=1 Tax=Hoplias malabaricus TaxID=27720 RepID=UPI003462EF62